MLVGVTLGLTLLVIEAVQRRSFVAQRATTQPVVDSSISDEQGDANRSPLFTEASPGQTPRDSTHRPDARFPKRSLPDVVKDASPPQAHPALLSPLEFSQTIDTSLRQLWRDNQLQPAERISREDWAGRVIDLLQPDVPNREALTQILSDGDRASAIDRFFNLRWISISDEMGRRLTIRLLQGRQFAQPDLALELRKFLSQEIGRRTPWNQIVDQLLDPPPPQREGDGLRRFVLGYPDEIVRRRFEFAGRSRCTHCVAVIDGVRCMPQVYRPQWSAI